MRAETIRIAMYARHVGNPHRVFVTVDKFPPGDWKDIPYKYRPPGLYWAESEGLVHFLYKDDKRLDMKEKGFGGSVWELKLESSGKTVKLMGPWSSRPGVMNKHFPACMDVVIRDKDSKGSGYAGNVTVEWLNRQFQELEIEDFIITTDRKTTKEVSYDVVPVCDPLNKREGERFEAVGNSLRPRDYVYIYRRNTNGKE